MITFFFFSFYIQYFFIAGEDIHGDTMAEQSRDSIPACDADPDVAIGIIDAALESVSKKRDKAHYAELVAKKGELLIQKYRNNADQEVLTLAVEQYKESLGIMPRTHLPVYADVSFDAGNAYRELAALTESVDLCDRALETYNASITYYTKDVDQLNHALILWNIAMAYHVYNACTSESKYLSKAVQAFEDAYGILESLGRAKEAAQVAFSLGTTRGDLAYEQSPVKNMRKAIEAYRMAATAYHDIDEVAEGETYHRMGNLFVGLAQSANNAEYIDEALASYRKASAVFTLESYPDIYAQISWSMGLAATVATTLREEPNDTAVLREAYANALKVYTTEDMPVEWFHGNLNIGLSYLVDNIKEPDTETYCNALESFERSWSAPKDKIEPALRAKVAHHYGTTLMSLAKYERPDGALQRAKDMAEEAAAGVVEEQELYSKLTELIETLDGQ